MNMFFDLLIVFVFFLEIFYYVFLFVYGSNSEKYLRWIMVKRFNRNFLKVYSCIVIL